MTGVPRGPEMLSVVMPVRGEERHVGEQVRALADQTYSGPWELVVVDNGCTDRTLEVVRDAAELLPSVQIVTASKRGLNHARNVGASAARGDFLVFCDADNVAAPGWLNGMAAAAPSGDLIAGRHEFERLNDQLTRAWCPWDPPDGPHDGYGFLPYAPGGNLGVWTAVARKLGWDEAFRFGGSDIEFSWRAQLASYRVTYAPDALMHRRFRSSLWSMARQYYTANRSVPLLYRRFRAHGMSRGDLPEGSHPWRELASRSPDLLRTEVGRGEWTRIAATLLGRLVGSVRFRAWFP